MKNTVSSFVGYCETLDDNKDLVRTEREVSGEELKPAETRIQVITWKDSCFYKFLESEVGQIERKGLKATTKEGIKWILRKDTFHPLMPMNNPNKQRYLQIQRKKDQFCSIKQDCWRKYVCFAHLFSQACPRQIFYILELKYCVINFSIKIEMELWSICERYKIHSSIFL